ncbi:MAG TPA: hypothetical protein VNT52_11820, partial [Acidimicrobiales bacterium]|nr:hypothetical protein [Acidimicrobiales bacterium]
MTTRTRARRTVAPLVLAFGLLLAGCAGGGSGPDKADAPAPGQQQAESEHQRRHGPPGARPSGHRTTVGAPGRRSGIGA